MDPLNKDLRKKTITNFLVVYGTSLLLVLGAGFFLFSSPVKVLKKDLMAYETADIEHDKLVSKADSITSELKKIRETDKEYLSSNNELEQGNLLNIMNQAETNIKDGLIDLKRDSIQLSSTLTRRVSQNFIVAYDALLSYRNTISFLRKTLIEKGINTTSLAKLQSDLEACNKEKEMYMLMVKNGPGGGGGGGDASKPLLEECNKELSKLKKTLEDSTTILRAYRSQPVKGACPPCPPGVDESQVLFNAAEDFMKRGAQFSGTLDKEGMYAAAIILYKKIQSTYADPGKVQSRLSEATKEFNNLKHS